jgi:serine protease Do
MGIISGLKRSGMGVTEYEDFIQTDAAINPGNSGGPLLNSKGELIGINDFIFSTSGGSQGIGFAIPAKMVRAVMDSMLTKGKVVRGYLGVSIQPLTADLVRQFNLTDKNGALIVDITEGGPAEKAGLKVGDVITAYDNRKIESMQELKNWVASTPPGKQVSIRISRDGKVLTKVVTMGESASQSSPATAVERQSAVPSAPKIVDNNLKGVSVRDVTDDILQRLGVKRKLRGVVITTISEDSPALGTLERGDIIIEMNRKPIQSTADFNQVASGIGKGQDILLLIVRGGASQYLTISTR